MKLCFFTMCFTSKTNSKDVFIIQVIYCVADDVNCTIILARARFTNHLVKSGRPPLKHYILSHFCFIHILQATQENGQMICKMF